MVCPSVASECPSDGSTVCVNVSGLLVELRSWPSWISRAPILITAAVTRDQLFVSGWRHADRRLGHHITTSLAIRRWAFQKLLGDAGRIRTVRLVGGEHLPADPDHLVGQRDDRHLAVAASFDGPNPLAERRAVPLQVHKGCVGALHKQSTQVRIPAFADGTQCGLPTGRVLTRHDSQPRRHVAPAPKHAPIAHRRDGGGGDQRPDTGDRLDTSARLGLRGPESQFPCRVVNLLVEREPPSSLAMQDLKETWREATLGLE